MRGLAGKTALISGSSRGIGRSIAEKLLKEGCVVFINGRDRACLDRTLAELREEAGSESVFALAGDLTESKVIREVFSKIRQAKDCCPNIVVANIGSGRSVLGWDVPDDEWERMFEINFFGAVRLCRQAITHMKEQGGGSIVCIGSIAGCESIPAPLPYSTAKAALLSYVKATSDAVADFGIRINAVSPGNVLFEGGVWDRKLQEDRAKVMDYIKRTVPLKGFGAPEQIAAAVAFLASDEAGFVTGVNFVVDGGQTRGFL